MARARRPAAGTLLLAAGAAMVAAGIALAAWSEASGALASHEAGSRFAEASSVKTSLRPEAVDAAFAAARDVNRRLAEGGVRGDLYEEAVDALDACGTDVVCWIEIPRLSLKAPVFRDCSEEHLMHGAGLVVGTSLPVGGAGTNTAVAGHTGMRGAWMFDRLGELEAGDRVSVWTLGRELRYAVRCSEVVDADDLDALADVPHRELLRLVTCRPGEKRLVVTAEGAGSGGSLGGKGAAMGA